MDRSLCRSVASRFLASSGAGLCWLEPQGFQGFIHLGQLELKLTSDWRIGIFFQLLNQPLPEDRAKILSRLSDDRLIVRDSSGQWDITNLGAILFARNLQEIKSLARKSAEAFASSAVA